MSDEQNTDPRAPAQPMSQEQLAALRLFLDDEFAGVTCHWPMTALRSHDRTLAARDHWRAMYRVGLEAYGDAHADIERLEAERDEARAQAVEWRSTTCSRSELADPANGFAFPWESSGAGGVVH